MFLFFVHYYFLLFIINFPLLLQLLHLIINLIIPNFVFILILDFKHIHLDDSSGELSGTVVSKIEYVKRMLKSAIQEENWSKYSRDKFINDIIDLSESTDLNIVTFIKTNWKKILIVLLVLITLSYIKKGYHFVFKK